MYRVVSCCVPDDASVPRIPRIWLLFCFDFTASHRYHKSFTTVFASQLGGWVGVFMTYPIITMATTSTNKDLLLPSCYYCELDTTTELRVHSSSSSNLGAISPCASTLHRSSSSLSSAIHSITSRRYSRRTNALLFVPFFFLALGHGHGRSLFFFSPSYLYGMDPSGAMILFGSD